MKTNHRKGFVAKPHTDNAMWHDTRCDHSAGLAVSAWIGNDFTDGNRGMAKAKRGAKKYMNSRIRVKQKAYVNKLVNELESGQDGNAPDC